MVPWSIPEIRPLKAPQGVHFLLSVGLPTLSGGLAEWWVTGAGPSWPLAPLALAYTVLLVLWASWRLRSRQGPLLKLWFWAMAALGLWASLSAAEGLPWPRTFALEGRHFLWFAVAFAQGQIGALWAGQLASRARLFQLIDRFPEGRVLEERVRDFQLDADYSRSNHAALSSSLVALGTGAVLLSIVSRVGSSSVSAWALAGYLTVCLLVGVLLRTYRREMEALMYGRRFTLADKLAPLGWSLVLASAAALGAWALLTLGGPWFDFSQFLPDRLVPPPPDRPPPIPRPSPGALLDGDYRLIVILTLLGLIFQAKHLGQLVVMLFQVAVWLIPVAAAAFLVWPLVRWLRSGGRETRGLLRRWVRLLRAQLWAFWQTLRLWWRGSPETGEDSLSLGRTGLRDWVRSFLTGHSPGRRKPYPEVVEAFLSLARWAEPLTVYRRGETTREYLDRLTPLVPDRGADLLQIRDLLDQELFGVRGLDASQRDAFLTLVKSVTATAASHEPEPGVS